MNNNNLNEAINESEISELCINIMNYADQISEIFSKIDSKVKILDNELDSDFKNEILSRYKSIKKNYSIIHNNILSYSTDLANLVNIMKDGEKIINKSLSNETNKIESRREDLKWL